MLHELFKKINAGPYLALHLSAGLLASVLFVWIFSGIANSVLDIEPLMALDIRVLEKVVPFRSPIGNVLMQTVTRFGGLFVGPATALIVCFLLFMKQNAKKAAAFSWVIRGGYILGLLLKEVIHRPRPVSVTALKEAGGWSSPSGHGRSFTVCSPPCW